MRWLAVGGQAATLYAASGWLHLPIEIRPLLAVFSLIVGSNIALSYLPESLKSRCSTLAVVQFGDVLLLTLILRFSGGPGNPFSIFYLLHVVLCAVLMDQVWTWSMAGLTITLFGLLFFFSPALQGMAAHTHGPGQLHAHLFGMWLAYTMVALITAYFVNRISAELRCIDSEAAAMKLNQQRLASLTTLSAGAAHELSTPLGTMAIALGEIRHRLQSSSLLPEVGPDLCLMKTQIDRCKDIIAKMSGSSGEIAGESVSPIRFTELLQELRQSLTQRFGSSVTLEADKDDEERLVFLPKNATFQAVLALTKNAVEASAGKGVRVNAAADNTSCRLRISDSGTGIPPEILLRVGEPFFSTKEAGQGMGLGVFLARLTAESIGGAFQIDSLPGRGTTVELTFPHISPC
jgi:two-component system sensor histidine kinase RegB